MKKLKWQKIFGLSMALILALSLAACGGSSKNSYDFAAPSGSTEESVAYDSYDGGYYDGDYEYEVDYKDEPSEAGGQASDNAVYFESRKLIRTVNMTVETKEFDKLLGALESRINALGGYIEDMYTYNGSSYSYYDSSRSANLTARIPKQQLDSFLNTVSENGNVVSRSENVKDVTLDYVDVQSRKDALLVEQERLLDMLKESGSLETMLAIEERLTDVRYELESAESRLRTMDNKVDFATVSLNIEEVKELTPIVEETVWERISNGFMGNLRDIGNGLVEFFIWFVVHIPNLLVWAVVIVLIVMIVRLCIRSGRKRKAKKLAKMQQKAMQQAMAQQAQPQPRAEHEGEASGSPAPDQVE